METGRVELGDIAQQLLSAHIEKKLTGLDPTFEISSIARVGTKVPDIQYKWRGKTYQVEVKHTSDFKRVTIYDKTVRRRSKQITEPDKTIFALKRSFFTGKTRAKAGMFEQYIDYIRSVDGISAAGFVGDEGISSKSGSLPVAYFKFNDGTSKSYILSSMRDHWKENRDSFFALVNSKTNRAAVFSTSLQKSVFLDRSVSPMKLSNVEMLKLDPVGQALTGTIRVGLRLTFQNISTFDLDI